MCSDPVKLSLPLIISPPLLPPLPAVVRPWVGEGEGLSEKEGRDVRRTESGSCEGVDGTRDVLVIPLLVEVTVVPCAFVLVMERRGVGPTPAKVVEEVTCGGVDDDDDDAEDVEATVTLLLGGVMNDREALLVGVPAVGGKELLLSCRWEVDGVEVAEARRGAGEAVCEDGGMEGRRDPAPSAEALDSLEVEERLILREGEVVAAAAARMAATSTLDVVEARGDID